MISHQELMLENTRNPGSERLRRIEGRHNSLLKELRQAFSRGELTASGECAIEGFRVIEEALRSGLRFRAVFVSESGQARAARLLPQIGSHVETVLLPDKLFAGSVPSETPQGLAALVHVKTHTLDQLIQNASSAPLLVVAGLQDPGNLGTILRSAEAFGAAGVVLGEGTVSVYNSKVVRASAGSVFRLPALKADLKNVIGELRARRFRLIATSSHKGTSLPKGGPKSSSCNLYRQRRRWPGQEADLRNGRADDDPAFRARRIAERRNSGEHNFVRGSTAKNIIASLVVGRSSLAT
jgi:TrmH family RNA methyltransferase